MPDKLAFRFSASITIDFSKLAALQPDQIRAVCDGVAKVMASESSTDAQYQTARAPLLPGQAAD